MTCPKCSNPLPAPTASRAENLDGTSGDAEVLQFDCPTCRSRLTLWRIPRVELVEGHPRTRWAEHWQA